MLPAFLAPVHAALDPGGVRLAILIVGGKSLLQLLPLIGVWPDFELKSRHRAGTGEAGADDAASSRPLPGPQGRLPTTQMSIARNSASRG